MAKKKSKALVEYIPGDLATLVGQGLGVATAGFAKLEGDPFALNPDEFDRAYRLVDAGMKPVQVAVRAMGAINKRLSLESAVERHEARERAAE